MTEQTITPAATDSLPDSYMTRDNNGDFHKITVQRCARCKLQIDPRVGSHPTCQKEADQERRMEENRLQKEEDIKMFGEVMPDERTRYMRLNPNARDTLTNKSYNMMQAEIEAARKEEERQKRMARIDRRERRLPDAERQLKSLQAAVRRDQEEELEEAAAEKAKQEQESNK
jgi:hypothetical protein